MDTVRARRLRAQRWSSARAALGADAFVDAWARATRSSRAAPRPAPASAGRPPSSRDELTAREVEVLQLVADGLGDAEVARRLVVSPRTVHSHLRSIYRKLA
jgi:DNA-binding NarL/FixJ family response regulator